MSYTNKDITKALSVMKEVCESYYNSGCTECPFGYDVMQNGGSTCRLQHVYPKHYEVADSRWKALD
jgi:hypothetical protein